MSVVMYRLYSEGITNSRVISGLIVATLETVKYVSILAASTTNYNHQFKYHIVNMVIILLWTTDLYSNNPRR